MPRGGARPPSTRCIRAASPTRTATGWATSPASRRGSTTWPSSGIDAVWLSPFYPSELADGGYDVADYRDVDPRLGTLDDFDAMVEALHARGIRVVVDIVPNHTSDLHAWFQEALAAAPGSAARERYIFREGKGPDGAEPPTDWVSVFGGSAWERVAGRAVVPAQLRRRAARPQLGQPRGAGRLRAHAAVLVGPRGRRVPHRRRAHAHEGPHRAAAARRPSSRRCPSTASTRSSTATTCTRSTPSGAGCSTSTTRRARPSPRRGSIRRACRSTRSAESLGQAFNFDLLQADFDAEQFRAHRHRQPRARGSSRARRRRGCSRTTTSCATPRATGCRIPARDANGRPARKHGNEWLLSGGTAARARPCGRPPPRAGRDTLRARACRDRPTSTRARSWAARSRRDPRRRSARIRPSSAARVWTRGGTDAACPLPWSAEVAVVRLRRAAARTCRSRRGSPLHAVDVQEKDPAIDAHRSTGGRSRSGTSCRPARSSTGSTPAVPTSCASRARTAGRS